MRQAGRRPGTTETRDEILAAARRLFADRGYDGTTIRAIAAEAGVNPALVHHFFGAKQQVFAAVLNFPLEPALILHTLSDGPRDQIGARMVRLFLAVWGDSASQPALLALLRSAMTNEPTAAMLRQFLERALLKQVAPLLNVPEERLTAAVGQMVGLAVLRYVVRLEPLASAGDQEIVDLVAPTIQRYIDGP